MAEFLYVLKPVRPGMLADGPTPDEERVIGEHYAHLQRLHRAGVVRLAGRTLTTGAETMGLVVFTAADSQAAVRLMGADPAVLQGVMSADVYPFRTALPEGGA